MILLYEPSVSTTAECPYLGIRQCRYEFFFACSLSGHELNELLKRGWRKFGTYFFKPRCSECAKCVPVRVRTDEFRPTKSQRRVLRLGTVIEVTYNPMEFRDEIYDVYRDHSLSRFGRETDRDEFITTFYASSCQSVQSEYFVGNRLIAVGFLDRSTEALSSVYFFFRSEYEHLSPGIFSILNEIRYAVSLELKYYYLGYYIMENRSMSYKNRFHPYEQYSWDENRWYPGAPEEIHSHEDK